MRKINKTTTDGIKQRKIKICDISHLFWGEYPYKAVVRYPLSEKNFNAHADYLGERKKIRSQIIDGVSSFTRTEINSTHFFFSSKEALEVFIEQNAERVNEIHLPRNQKQVDALRSNPNVRVRDGYYWGKFKWMMTFQTDPYISSCPVIAAVDQWVENYFYEPDEDRFYHSLSNDRRLYFRDLMDVVAAKLSLGEHVRMIEEIILFSEL